MLLLDEITLKILLTLPILGMDGWKREAQRVIDGAHDGGLWTPMIGEFGLPVPVQYRQYDYELHKHYHWPSHCADAYASVSVQGAYSTWYGGVQPRYLSTPYLLRTPEQPAPSQSQFLAHSWKDPKEVPIKDRKIVASSLSHWLILFAPQRLLLPLPTAPQAYVGKEFCRILDRLGQVNCSPSNQVNVTSLLLSI